MRRVYVSPGVPGCQTLSHSSGGVGLPSKKPWTRSQPSVSSTANSSSVSTPSAVAVTFKPCAKPMIACTRDFVLAARSIALHEALVDLQIVDRQTVQVTQRRVARPKIVDGDTHSQGPQFGELPGSVLAVPHQHSLGEFHLQIARLHVVRP